MSVNVEQLSRTLIPFVDEYYDRLVYERDTLGRFRLKPDQKLPHLTINRLGYRGAEFSGKESVLLLGDSVTFGVGASSDATRFARFWERTIGQEVADASVRAYRVSQHFVQLPTLLDQLPALRTTVLWCGFADLLYWAVNHGRIEGAFQMDVKYPEQAAWTRRLSTLFKREVRPATASPAAGDISALVRYVIRYVTAIRDLNIARGIKTHVLLQPFIRVPPVGTTLRTITDFYDESTQRKCGIGWYAAALRYVHELSVALEGKKIPFIDLQADVQESDFLDQVHLREEAHFKLAQKGIF